MLGFLLILAALICGLALLFSVQLGALTPFLVAIAIICLAVAMLIGVRAPWGRGP
jgi:hypothetical protein